MSQNILYFYFDVFFRSAWSSEWPWCHEEWAGGDEGGMEVYTCFCKDNLCNDNTFLLPKFNEWISVTRARLKSGTSHPLDIVTSIATFGIAGFFVIIVLTNIPWNKILGKPNESKDDENENDEDSEDENDSEIKKKHTKND